MHPGGRRIVSQYQAHRRPVLDPLPRIRDPPQNHSALPGVDRPTHCAFPRGQAAAISVGLSDRPASQRAGPRKISVGIRSMDAVFFAALRYHVHLKKALQCTALGRGVLGRSNSHMVIRLAPNSAHITIPWHPVSLQNAILSYPCSQTFF
jgi:hypothetical protein